RRLAVVGRGDQPVVPAVGPARRELDPLGARRRRGRRRAARSRRGRVVGGGRGRARGLTGRGRGRGGRVGPVGASGVAGAPAPDPEGHDEQAGDRRRARGAPHPAAGPATTGGGAARRGWHPGQSSAANQLAWKPNGTRRGRCTVAIGPAATSRAPSTWRSLVSVASS